MSRGSLPSGEWRPAGNGPRSAGTGDVCGARAAGRTEGEGRGEADRQAPAGGRRGREERQARGARGPARERRRWAEPRLIVSVSNYSKSISIEIKPS
jgi:hypothetical protein